MGYGEKVKKWFFEEDDDDVYENQEIDQEEDNGKTSLFEKAKSTKTTDAMKALSANKDSHLILFKTKKSSSCEFTSFTKRTVKTCD